jgi:hypothetical protein
MTNDQNTEALIFSECIRSDGGFVELVFRDGSGEVAGMICLPLDAAEVMRDALDQAIAGRPN